MTSKDDSVRAKATHKFREELEQLTVNQEESEFLIEFFLHKLSDPQSLLDTTYILLKLSKSSKSIHPSFIKMIQNKQIIIPTFSREARINFYQIFLAFPITFELAAIILQSIIGEKDPRNILVAFQLCDAILEVKNIGTQYKREIFEFLDCYYPIEFNEKADPRFQIKKVEIEHILNKCLFSEVLLNDSILLLQDKIVSAYDRAQGSALKSVMWIIKNQNKITALQIEEIYESIQKLAEQVIMDDDVIEQIPITLIEICNNERFQKVKTKIKTISLKTLEEIPATQQGFIYFNFLKLLVQNHGETIFRDIVQIFNKKFDTKNINVTQKRLENVISAIAEYKKYNREFVSELDNNQKSLLYDKLQQGITHKMQNVFILTLKCLADIMKYYQDYQKDLELYLYNQINNRELIEQQCILDYFAKNGIVDIKQYQQLLAFWSENNQLLYDYSLTCSLYNIQDYFSQFTLGLINNQNYQIKSEQISALKGYLDNNSISNSIRQDQAQLVINHIYNPLNKNRKNKLIKQLIQFILKQFALNQNIIKQITLDYVLHLEDDQIYYYIPLMEQELNENLIQSILEIIYKQDFKQRDVQITNRKYAYKFIYTCLSKYQKELNLDFPQLSTMETQFNDHQLNQLQLYIVLLRQQMLFNNEIALEKLKEISQSHPQLLSQIIKHKDLENKPSLQKSIGEMIKQLNHKQTLNYLINQVDEEFITGLANPELLQLIIEHFNDTKIDKLKSLALIVNWCPILKKQTISRFCTLQLIL
ncbi:unnamed protein product (macronuclear) [Paramecium tetraurelia]|uniref:MMS19 nucleotide excision repair protein n=1 Tax=Paramecium tetraurelia TaxID=5888 RepID=A0D0W1_PARTE|nr:uncharacterized protein GSPATT00012230001 [Paramecium tetraurelia]CAK76678.1 unnamed protein product [Paramecium tetraurelia]|eukprot:XP_001444075.1 hypothetical protein (macronuclear) [Paramecium tetraurelia strain d4-2]